MPSPVAASSRHTNPVQESNGLDLVFYANGESGKTDDLKFDNDVNLGFVTPSGEWASIAGKATVDTTRDAVHKYYTEDLRAWMGDLKDVRGPAGAQETS